MKTLLIATFACFFCIHAYGQKAQSILEEATNGTIKIVIEGLIESKRVTLLEIQDEKSLGNFIARFEVIDPKDGLGEINEDTIFLSCFCVPDYFITFEKSNGSVVTLGTKHKMKEVEFLQGSATPNLPRLKATKQTTKQLSRLIKKARKDLANQALQATSASARRLS